MAIITKEQDELRKEIYSDPIAKSLLLAKCEWEHMSPYAVLREWGDPRTWHNGRVYKEAIEFERQKSRREDANFKE